MTEGLKIPWYTLYTKSSSIERRESDGEMWIKNWGRSSGLTSDTPYQLLLYLNLLGWDSEND